MERGKVSEVLVVPPLYFDVVDSYNTRMRPDHPFGKPDKRKALEQWSRMISALRHDLGINMYFIDPVEKLYDMAFACDSGLWIDNFFILANFQVTQRELEIWRLGEWFREHHYQIIHLPKGALFEGGDCVMVGNTALIGYGESRTNKAGIEALTTILGTRGIKVVPIRRITEEFYHLNSVLTVYPSAKLICYYTAAFQPLAYHLMHEALPDHTITPLSSETVLREHPDFGGERLYSYCLNAIENNGKVLQPYCSETHREIFKNAGLEVIVPEGGSSEFERSGGSYRCLTMIHNITA